MRSEILCQQLREDKARKRVEGKRKSRKMYMRAYRKRHKVERAVIEPSHPTLSKEAILAVEEAAEYGKMRDSAHVFAPESTPRPDCTAALAEFERRAGEHIKELGLQKYGPAQTAELKTVPTRPFDLGGIIL